MWQSCKLKRTFELRPLCWIRCYSWLEKIAVRKQWCSFGQGSNFVDLVGVVAFGLPVIVRTFARCFAAPCCDGDSALSPWTSTTPSGSPACRDLAEASAWKFAGSEKLKTYIKCTTRVGNSLILMQESFTLMLANGSTRFGLNWVN